MYGGGRVYNDRPLMSRQVSLAAPPNPALLNEYNSTALTIKPNIWLPKSPQVPKHFHDAIDAMF